MSGYEQDFLCFNQNNFGFSGEVNFGTVLTPPISGSGKAMFNSLCTSDPNVFGGIITNNAAVPYYLNSQVPSGYLGPSSVCTNFGGTWNGTTCTGGQISQIVNAGSAPANLAAIGFDSAASLALSYNSPYIGRAHVSNDGADIGADMNALAAARGAVGTPTVSPNRHDHSHCDLVGL